MQEMVRLQEDRYQRAQIEKQDALTQALRHSTRCGYTGAYMVHRRQFRDSQYFETQAQNPTMTTSELNYKILILKKFMPKKPSKKGKEKEKSYRHCDLCGRDDIGASGYLSHRKKCEREHGQEIIGAVAGEEIGQQFSPLY